ncbi:MAG: 5'-methylthioadenosine/adenosylhomocysteine nucleosidase [Lachnospiraceae bacterium]|nr:5'-methylthioadenosine/adenosylhomocysteine nucleosidase [Lachnospiraceae bacterium]
MLGIIGAMENEVAGLKDMMRDVEIVTYAGMDYYHGFLEEKEVVVVQSGIGKVNAAICTQTLVDKFNISAIINIGVAVALRDETEIGDVVISTDAVEHDMNAMPLGYDRGIIPGMETSFFVADDGLIELAKKSVNKNSDVTVFQGRVVSGDLFVEEQKIKEKLIAEFDGYCAEMEGGAIAHCACVNKVPFVVIRFISDKFESGEEVEYSSYDAGVMEDSIRIIADMVKDYTPQQPVERRPQERKLKNKDITYRVNYKNSKLSK